MREQISSLFAAAYTQRTRLLRLTTPLGEDTLLAESVRGEEAINQVFRFTISALSLNANLSLRALLGQPALLQMLTTHSQTPRSFHGYLTAIEIDGSNGGMARYTLTLQPWLAFLGHTRDSRMFQDMTVLDILDAVFRTWRNRGGPLAPAWRFDIADTGTYPKRSLTTQYQESDLAFAERLMSEEGMFYFFEHQPDGDSPGLGSHRLVIADHNGAFQPNTQSTVRYTRPGAVMAEDSIDRWRHELSLRTSAVELRSWDYRSRQQRPVSSSGMQPGGIELVDRDALQPYAYPNRKHGQRIADRRLEALEARRDLFIGAGTVRTFAPGTTFELNGHAIHDEEDRETRTFTVTRVVHQMHNNLTADLKSHIVEWIGESHLIIKPGEDRTANNRPGERPLYRNRIDAIRAHLPYRPSRTDEHGNLLHPAPLVRGQQSAIVVGAEGAVIHTDRDHRIKVQFHWQRDARTGMSHSRMTHPYPDGQSGAPGDDRSGTWVRVATPLAPIAGANWGSHALPRVGQEVLVEFLEGHIDRPVVIGALYNGLGKPDAQHNTFSYGAGAATANAPAWFPGQTGNHAHPAVLSGLKSQSMQSSQIGAGGYRQLVFDDSPGQGRVSLQNYASAYKGADEINLGHVRHQVDNQRLQSLGSGAELKTEHSLAVRAGRGLLLSTDQRSNVHGAHLDSSEAETQIDTGRALQESLSLAAQKHNARLKDESAPAQAPQATSCTIATTADGVTYSEPQIQLSSPTGIVTATPANAIFSVSKSSSLSAGQDVNAVANGNSLHAVKAGITLFTVGKAKADNKPNHETGIAMHAASGGASVQSQSNETRLTADKALTVASVTRNVAAMAEKHILLTAQGAYLKLEGGNIMLHAPGKIDFKASMKELAGPADGSIGMPALPQSEAIYNEAFVVMDEDTKAPMAYVRYRLESASGVKIEGITDALGRTQRIFTSRSEKLTLYLPKDD